MWLALLALSGAFAQDSARFARLGPDGSCERVQPDLYRIAVHGDTYNRREDLLAVLARVKLAAEDELFAHACAQRTTAQCAAIRQQVATDADYDLDRRVICASAIVPDAVVRDPDGLAKHEAALDRLATEVAAKVGAGPVVVLPPRWTTGCGVGEPGERLSAALRGRLVGRGVTVKPAGDGGTERLLPRLAPGVVVGVDVLGQDAADPVGTVLAAAELSPAWLGIVGRAGTGCRTEAAVPPRPGAGGLSVDLSLDPAEVLCPGEQATLRLRASKPAAVQLWSVGVTGEAWLVWSSQTEVDLRGGLLDRALTLMLQVDSLPDLGQETLVALASAGPLPSAAAPGCRLDDFDAASIPAGAALARLPFDVLPSGRGRCGIRPDAPDPKATWAEYRDAPPCR